MPPKTLTPCLDAPVARRIFLKDMALHRAGGDSLTSYASIEANAKSNFLKRKTHQVNRVAALAVSAAEMLKFGKVYMAQIVKNSKALAKALDQSGIPVLGAKRGYTQTHQVIADVRKFGGGLTVAEKLAQASIITNKNLIPGDFPENWDRPGGLRIATIEITRLGLTESDMDTIERFFERVLIDKEEPGSVRKDVEDIRLPLQNFYYCFDNGWPPSMAEKDKNKP